MTKIYSTNFDADSVGSLPAGWTNKVGTWAVRTSGAVSSPNALASTSNADGDVVLYTGASAVADMGVSFAMKQTISPTVPPLMGLVLRSDVGNANNYTIVFGGATSGQVAVLLFKKVSGTFSQITTGTFALSQAVGDTIYIRATIVGSSIKLYVGNGSLPSTPSVAFTDSSITAAGYSGLYNGKNNQTVSMAIDDFMLDDGAAVADTTGPVLSNPTASQTGQNTASGSVTTNEGNGTLYRYASTNATETASVVKASGLTTAVTATGAQAVTFAGLTAGTTYFPHYLQTDAAGNDSAVANGASFTTASASAPVNNAFTNSGLGILFSPATWDIQASSAKTINAGAHFKTIFSGTSCTLNFDMTGIASPVPQISYRVDGFGPWITTNIASSIAITIQPDTADYANKPGHLLEVIVKSTTETQARWSTQATAVKLTGIVLDAGKALTAPLAKPLRGLFFGDSITEGVRTVNMTATSDTDRNDAAQGWAYTAGQILGAEVGIIGFGASGFIATGSGGVPPLPTSYNLLYAGVARSFAPQPDFIVLMEGTNDSGDVTSPATTVLNGLLASTTTTKIIVLRPFNGSAHASQLQAAVAACSAPSRVTYVDTAGWFTTANSSDNLHPYGVENITHIAPLAAASIRSVLNAAPAGPTLNTRTVTITLRNPDKSLAANLSGIKVAAFDEPLPSARTVARFTSAVETTDVNGVMTFAMQSTLATGAKCGVSVQLTDGSNFDVQATVA